jgi:flagellar protein FliO/FliZ
LGGEKLKLSLHALLFLLAGFLVQISLVSAQEVPSSAVDPLLAAELAITFDEEDIPATPVAGPSTWVVIRMVLTLVLAAVAIYGVVFLIKKSSRQTVTKDPFLKVLAAAHLGANLYAHVVSVGNKAWLMGSSDGGVNLIGEIDDQDVLNAMLLEDSRKTSESSLPGRFPDFISMLRRLGLPSETITPGADDIRRHRERLKDL